MLSYDPHSTPMAGSQVFLKFLSLSHVTGAVLAASARAGDLPTRENALAYRAPGIVMDKGLHWVFLAPSLHHSYIGLNLQVSS